MAKSSGGETDEEFEITGEPIAFDTTPNGVPLEIIDRIERHHYSLYGLENCTPVPAQIDRFLFPVDAGVTVTTKEIRLPTVVPVYLRDTAGDIVGEAEHYTHEQFSQDEYHIELNTPIKIYLHVSSAVEVGADATQTYLRFDEETEVTIGARSNHSQPAATITTSSAPEDLMTAISHLGSALKTLSSERSYPNLRGHPPVLELGDRLSIPTGIQSPETGVQIEIPPKYKYIFAVAPLAYYLGANVTRGPSPKIVTETGFEHPIENVYGFEAEVERILKQVFFLDCVTRTEGFYQFDLYERDAIEPDVDLEFESLYGEPLAVQLEQYLSIPYHHVVDYIPEWKLTTHIEPTPENIDALSYVVDDLAIVRSPDVSNISESDISSEAVSEFMRDGALTLSTS